jgi:arginyl-tRNA synthetase
MNIQTLREKIVERIQNACIAAFGDTPSEIDVGFPPDVKMGHFGLACFPMAKLFRRAPAEIARQMADNLVVDEIVKEATAAGPYLNLTVSSAVLFGTVCNEINGRGQKYGETGVGQGKRVMDEYLSPNTNKPLHLGHLRNGALGMAVARMFAATGHDVVKSILVNDRGVHICKSMLAWQRWGDGQTPETSGIKGDHFVGDWYVRYARESDKDPALEKEVQQMLQRWEGGDPETVTLWKTMNAWVYDGFSRTYDDFGLEFDVTYYESDTYKLGKEHIQAGLEKGVFSEDDRGNVVFMLPEDRFGLEKGGQPKRVTVLRPDGTSLYITQDIATSIIKNNEQQLDYSIWVVGSEQEHHFKCLFEILRALGHRWADDCYHLSYGMVNLPDGKMKSREGKVVDADDLILELKSLAEEEIRSRDTQAELTDEEVTHRAEVIGVGAIKFYLLRVKPTQSISFDPRESISFDGFTGPYCQYAYARICGILQKAKESGADQQVSDFSTLGNAEELALLQKLMQLPDEVTASVREINPARLATHIFNTARAFNQFYNKHPVLHGDTPSLVSDRLALIAATAEVLKKGLHLLGVDVLENM